MTQVEDMAKIDLTLLRPDATQKDIESLKAQVLASALLT